MSRTAARLTRLPDPGSTPSWTLVSHWGKRGITRRPLPGVSPTARRKLSGSSLVAASDVETQAGSEGGRTNFVLSRYQAPHRPQST